MTWKKYLAWNDVNHRKECSQMDLINIIVFFFPEIYAPSAVVQAQLRKWFSNIWNLILTSICHVYSQLKQSSLCTLISLLSIGWHFNCFVIYSHKSRLVTVASCYSLIFTSYYQLHSLGTLSSLSITVISALFFRL